MTPLRLEPTTCLSWVRHSTTEPLCSLQMWCQKCKQCPVVEDRLVMRCHQTYVIIYDVKKAHNVQWWKTDYLCDVIKHMSSYMMSKKHTMSSGVRQTSYALSYIHDIIFNVNNANKCLRVEGRQVMQCHQTKASTANIWKRTTIGPLAKSKWCFSGRPMAGWKQTIYKKSQVLLPWKI